MMQFLRGIGTVTLLLGLLLGVPMVAAVYTHHQTSSRVSCAVEKILYPSIEEPLSYKYEGYRQVIRKGEVGAREICKKASGSLTSSEVIKEPVTEVVGVGTARPKPYVAPTYSVRTGAICNDGSYSGATGRGACSWHGGVSHWLYQ